MPDQAGYYASLRNAAGKVFTYLHTISLDGTDGKTLTIDQDTVLDEAVSISSKAPKIAPALIKGAELGANGNFDLGDSGWTKGEGWAIVDQGGGDYQAVATDVGDGITIGQAVTELIVGRVYELKVICSNFSAGAVSAWVSGIGFGNILTGTGVSTYLFTAENTIQTVGACARGGGIATTLKISSITFNNFAVSLDGDLYSTGNAKLVIPTFANNAAAITGGLVIGQFYLITGTDTVGIVHS